jgi:fatty-acyl-CoA synthase
LHNQQGLTTHAVEIAQAIGLHIPGTVTLQPMPLCGGFGLCQMLSTFAAGKPAVIQDRWDIEHMAHLINLHRVTNFCGTDDLIIRLLATSILEIPFPSMRWCGYATFSAGLGDWFASAENRGLRPVGLYGASEVQALYAVQRPSDPIALRCVDGGFPVSRQAMVRVRDTATGNLLPNDAVGELELFGPSCMACYDNDSTTTLRAITDDGFVHVGDYGRILENGSFIFEGRSGDWLRVSGFLVASTEIETLVEALPNIEGCRVVGANWKGVQRPFAFVTLHKGAEFDEQAILAACTAELARHKVPIRVARIDAFPITDGPNGVKIQKHVLQRMAAAALGEPSG